MEIPFASSSRSSVGLEWELMLADPESGDLVPAAPGILQVLDGGEKITAELLTNTIEVTSDPRQNVSEAIGEVGSTLTSVLFLGRSVSKEDEVSLSRTSPSGAVSRTRR